jgi:hypothetical protein
MVRLYVGLILPPPLSVMTPDSGRLPMVKVYVVAVAGVKLMFSVPGEAVIPGGGLPVAIVGVEYGGVPPVAVSVWL